MTLTNNFNIPFPLSFYLAQDNYDYSSDKDSISATTLIKPTRQFLLGVSGELDANIDILDLFNVVEGNAFHSAMEIAIRNFKENGKKLGYCDKEYDLLINPSEQDLLNYPNKVPTYIEKRISKEFMGFTILGKPDLILDGVLEDHKKVKAFSFMKGNSYKDYILQASIYRWLLPNVVTSDIFYINYNIKDWNKREVGKKNYPEYPLFKKSYNLLSIEETESFIKNRLKLLLDYRKGVLTKDNIPFCSEEEMWLEPSIYKYYTKPENIRATGVYDNYHDAELAKRKNSNKGTINEVKGKAKRCDYCIKDICKQYKEMNV